mgnify:CR=1 FL=1
MPNGPETPKWYLALAWVVGLSVPAAIGWVRTDVNDIESELRQLRVDVAENSAHRVEHDRNAEEWKQRIRLNESGLRELTNNASARPDPFTGTEGRQLERRIDILERLPAQLKRLRSDIDRLHKMNSEDRTYYRQNVVPLIEQSNLLQIQRIQEQMQ